MTALSTPPHYDYKTDGPWLVTHVLPDGKKLTWVMWNLKAAVLRFWQRVDLDVDPVRRLVVDAFGVTILGHDRTPVDGSPILICTREAGDLAIASQPDPDKAAEIVWMLDMVRSVGGVVF